MRTILLLTAISLFACKRRPAPASLEAAPSEQLTTASVAPLTGTVQASSPDAISGRVQEKIDVNQYTYLRIASPGGEVWAAVPKSAVAVGDTVSVLGAMWMENFKSATLDRTWPRIAFGTLQGGAAPARPPPAASAEAQAGAVKVAKASGPNGRTISDIYQQRGQLKERSVAVRGKVVKATNGVLGKNWLHLRDGSGEGATADLAVSSAQTAGVGATVLVTGTLRLDRDLGSGYHYDVIVEDAKVQAE
jgi:hypothetical protein